MLTVCPTCNTEIALKGDRIPDPAPPVTVWTYNFSSGKYHIREQGNGDCVAHTHSKEHAARIVQDHARAQFQERRPR